MTEANKPNTPTKSTKGYLKQMTTKEEVGTLQQPRVVSYPAFIVKRRLSSLEPTVLRSAYLEVVFLSVARWRTEHPWPGGFLGQ